MAGVNFAFHTQNLPAVFILIHSIFMAVEMIIMLKYNADTVMINSTIFLIQNLLGKCYVMYRRK